MMSVSEYASDVGKKVKEILSLCKELSISVSSEDDMLSDDDIIMLDNEIASLEDVEEVEDNEVSEESEEYEDSYEAGNTKPPVEDVTPEDPEMDENYNSGGIPFDYSAYFQSSELATDLEEGNQYRK